MRQRNIVFIIFFILALNVNFSLAQCPPNPSITLSSNKYEITVDDFSELSNSITFSTYLNVTAPAAACQWDLFAHLVTIPPLAASPAYSAQGTSVGLGNIDIRAINTCETPNQTYAGVQPPCLVDRICGSFSAPLDATDDYIVGTPGGVADGVLNKNAGACILPVTQINGTGSAGVNITTHQFRIDFRINLGAIAAPVKPGLYDIQMSFNIAVDGGAAPVDIEDFRIELDIQPILQLKMSTAPQIDFTFSDIKQYQAGIIKYGATILEVNSSLEWDLMAVGTSEATIGALFWDNPVSYSGACVAPNNQIPLEALELKQTPANPSGSGADVDYSPDFVAPGAYNPFPPAGNFVTGDNNIEVGVFPFGVGNFSTGNVAGNLKTIAGNWGAAGGVDNMNPGSFQIPPNTLWSAGYRYVIDYRILPGLPVTFGGFMANYACPGVYTMQVKYILAEDQ